MVSPALDHTLRMLITQHRNCSQRPRLGRGTKPARTHAQPPRKPPPADAFTGDGWKLVPMGTTEEVVWRGAVRDSGRWASGQPLTRPQGRNGVHNPSIIRPISQAFCDRRLGLYRTAASGSLRLGSVRRRQYLDCNGWIELSPLMRSPSISAGCRCKPRDCGAQPRLSAS